MEKEKNKTDSKSQNIKKNQVKLSFNNFSVDSKHEDIMILAGTIATVDTPSLHAPIGTDDCKLLIPKAAAEEYAQSFIGMPVNCLYTDWAGTLFTGHADLNWNYGQIIGFISEVEVVDGELKATMNIWKDIYSGLSDTIINAADSLGFSVELTMQEYETNFDTKIVTLNKFKGTGCSLLWKNCAAFGDQTYISKLVASREKEINEMNEEMIKKIADEVKSSIQEDIKKLVEASKEKEPAKAEEPKVVESGKAEPKTEVQAGNLENNPANAFYEAIVGKLTELTKEVSEVKASMEAKESKAPEAGKVAESGKAEPVNDVKAGAIPAPKSIENPFLGGNSFEGEFAKIEAGKDIRERIKQKAALRLKQVK